MRLKASSEQPTPPGLTPSRLLLREPPIAQLRPFAIFGLIIYSEANLGMGVDRLKVALHVVGLHVLTHVLTRCNLRAYRSRDNYRSLSLPLSATSELHVCISRGRVISGESARVHMSEDSQNLAYSAFVVQLEFDAY